MPPLTRSLVEPGTPSTPDGTDTIYASCLEGLRDCLRVACEFSLETERQAIMELLAQLVKVADQAHVRAEHVEAVHCLLQCAMVEGNYLGDAWNVVLSNVSQLDAIFFVPKVMSPLEVCELSFKNYVKDAKKKIDRVVEAKGGDVKADTISADKDLQNAQAQVQVKWGLFLSFSHTLII